VVVVALLNHCIILLRCEDENRFMTAMELWELIGWFKIDLLASFILILSVGAAALLCLKIGFSVSWLSYFVTTASIPLVLFSSGYLASRSMIIKNLDEKELSKQLERFSNRSLIDPPSSSDGA